LTVTGETGFFGDRDDSRLELSSSRRFLHGRVFDEHPRKGLVEDGKLNEAPKMIARCLRLSIIFLIVFSSMLDESFFAISSRTLFSFPAALCFILISFREISRSWHRSTES